MAENRKIEDDPINPGVINLRLKLLEDAVKEGNATTQTILQKVNGMNYVPRKEFDDLKETLDRRFQVAKDLADATYRKKVDGRNLRAIGIIVVSAAVTAFVTILVSFITRGGLNNV